MGDGSLHRLESASLADQAYDALREAIISGELAPNEKITERGLAERLSVSPTPVREALRRLEQDRLVERRGPRHVQVVELDETVLDEVRLAEAALRGVAARLAASNATPAQVGRMAELLAGGDAEVARLQAQHPDSSTVRPADLAPLLEITRQFHAAVNAGCNNPVVLRLLSLVEAFSLAARQQRLVGELDARGARDALARYDEHHRILDAVRAGDGEALERLLHDHARPTAAV